MTSWCSVQELVSLGVVVALCAVGLNVASGGASGAFEGVQRLEYPEPFGKWVTALPDGRLMTSWTDDKEGATDETGSVQQASARYSSDNGLTWGEPQFLFEFPRSEGKCRFSTGVTVCDKQGGIHLFGGYWCDWSWEKFVGHYMPCHVMSDDNGETWYDIRDSRFIAPGSPPAMLKRADGRIIVVWNNSQKPKHTFDRLVLAAAISDDEGQTWRAYREVVGLDVTGQFLEVAVGNPL